MAMPVPTAHTMMPKRRLDEVSTLLIAQCSEFSLWCVQPSTLFSQFYLSLTLKLPALGSTSFMCFEAKQRGRSVYLMSYEGLDGKEVDNRQEMG